MILRDIQSKFLPFRGILLLFQVYHLKVCVSLFCIQMTVTSTIEVSSPLTRNYLLCDLLSFKVYMVQVTRLYNLLCCLSHGGRERTRSISSCCVVSCRGFSNNTTLSSTYHLKLHLRADGVSTRTSPGGVAAYWCKIQIEEMEHTRSNCKQCGGSSIKQCSGSSICEHNRQWYYCKHCTHRLRSSCHWSDTARPGFVRGFSCPSF